MRCGATSGMAEMGWEKQKINLLTRVSRMVNNLSCETGSCLRNQKAELALKNVQNLRKVPPRLDF